jgi:hypothetical protein
LTFKDSILFRIFLIALDNKGFICLAPHAFWNITDFGAKCEKCDTINTITLEEGELKKQE